MPSTISSSETSLEGLVENHNTVSVGRHFVGVGARGYDYEIG
jgi:hypothetical protein